MVAAAAILAIVAYVGRSSPLDEAKALVEDDVNFETAFSTGQTFLDIGKVLKRAGEACEDDKGPNHPDCDVMFTANAYATISAVDVLRCTRPGVFDARETMRTYLAELAANKHPDPPRGVTCTPRA